MLSEPRARWTERDPASGLHQGQRPSSAAPTGRTDDRTPQIVTPSPTSPLQRRGRPQMTAPIGLDPKRQSLTQLQIFSPEKPALRTNLSSASAARAVTVEIVLSALSCGSIRASVLRRSAALRTINRLTG